MIPPGWNCPRRIGFLFPHPCERISPIGCPDCENGRIADPYASHPERSSYESYEDYSDLGLESGPALMFAESDFTEADGENLRRESFEDDFTGS